MSTRDDGNKIPPLRARPAPQRTCEKRDKIFRGGIAQRDVCLVAQAPGEEIVYEADGRLLTGSFMDYPMPRAGDLPRFRIELHELRHASDARKLWRALQA